MSQVRTLSRFAVDRWLRVVRMPIDAAAHVLPENGASRNAAMLAVDRVDASARAAAGNLLKDDVLLDDAARRRAALEERQRALELRDRAGEKARQADDRLGDDLDRAERLRRDAERGARTARQRVAEESVARTAQVKRTAAAQERAADEAKAARVRATEKQAKRLRVQVLDEQTDALEQEAGALTAADEAHRLAQAAGSAKAARKGTAPGSD